VCFVTLLWRVVYSRESYLLLDGKVVLAGNSSPENGTELKESLLLSDGRDGRGAVLNGGERRRDRDGSVDLGGGLGVGLAGDRSEGEEGGGATDTGGLGGHCDCLFSGGGLWWEKCVGCSWRL
jgi:hypothetical protein